MRAHCFIGLLLCILVTIGIGISLWGYKNTRKEIVTIDLNHLITSLAKSPKYQEMKEEEFARASQKYLVNLDRILKSLAKQERLIIMPKQAVVAGAVDITNQVKEIIEEESEILGERYDTQS